MQKLISIYLENTAYTDGKWVRGSYGDKHGFCEEHLEEYLQDGWRIVDINAFGGSSEGISARGWVLVVLEK
ncbi:MAG: hypothetical protein AAGA67_05565 [Cyanobacteria bacterium P01_F01_bin.153]